MKGQRRPLKSESQPHDSATTINIAVVGKGTKIPSLLCPEQEIISTTVTYSR